MVHAWDCRVVARDVGREDGKRAPDQRDGAVGMPAGAAAVHLAESALETRQKVMIRLAAGQAGEVVGDGWEPKDAGSALSCALKRQIAADASGFCDPARGRPEYHDHANAGTGADSPKGMGRVRSSKMVGSDPAPAEAADKERLRCFRGNAALRDIPQRRAPVDLDHPGVGHGSSDGDEAGARLIGRPPSAKRTGTLSGDEGDVGEGFRVVHEGRPSTDSQRSALVGPEDRGRRA